MPADTKRSLDSGQPFLISAPAPAPGEPTCGHGVWVETRFEDSRGAPDGAITLLLRSAEQLEPHSVRVEGEPTTVTLSPTMGRCMPRDERAQRFLDATPWLRAALVERLDWLRERARRAEAQRHRKTSYRAALEAATPGAMIPYDTLFPADWDLLLRHDGATYWAIDHHCSKAACRCADIVVEFHSVDSPVARHVGEVRFDLEHRHPKASTPLAAKLFDRLWARHQDELVRRRTEVRNAVVRRSSMDLAQRAEPTVEAPRPTVARSAPCPCGSGKKYKRCCAARERTSASVTPRGRGLD